MLAKKRVIAAAVAACLQGNVGAAIAQTRDEVQLPGVKVRTGSEYETAAGPVAGYIATRAATASKTDTSLIETPQSISVITRDRMDAQKVNSASEALLYTPGVSGTVRDERTDFFVIRGFDAATCRDGLPIGSSGPALPRFDIYGAERIEVLHGPASVLYGQNSPGGMANIITKRPTAEKLREIELQAGNFNPAQGAFDMGGPVDGDDMRLYRLTGLARDSKTSVDFVRDDRIFIAPAFTWRASGIPARAGGAISARDGDTVLVAGRLRPAVVSSAAIRAPD